MSMKALVCCVLLAACSEPATSIVDFPAPIEDLAYPPGQDAAIASDNSLAIDGVTMTITSVGPTSDSNTWQMLFTGIAGDQTTDKVLINAYTTGSGCVLQDGQGPGLELEVQAGTWSSDSTIDCGLMITSVTTGVGGGLTGTFSGVLSPSQGDMANTRQVALSFDITNPN